MILRPAGLLVRQGCLLLMGYRYGEGDRFNLPGGKPDPGETLTRALAREWQEELELAITVGELALVAETAIGEREVLHLLFHVTAAGEPRLNPGQTSAVSLVWLPIPHLAATPLYPAVGADLPAMLAHNHPASRYVGRVAQPWLG